MNRSHHPALRIGVLPPGSSFVPLLADDIVAALELGLADGGATAELIPEFADCNADIKIIAPKVQHLLIARRVACVVAPLNVAVMDTVASHFQNRAAALVALSLGEDPFFETAHRPCLFVNSFELWRAAWLCGYLGVRQFGPRAAILLALHEAGYGLGFAFQLGVEAADGVILQTQVTHRHSRSEDPTESIEAVAALTPDFIWAGYSGTEAVSFLQALAASSLATRIPVIGLPPLADGHVREAAKGASNGLHIVEPVSNSAETHPAFTALRHALGRPPHPYAQLAYESGRLIAAAHQRVRTETADFAQALSRAEYDGPRGITRFDNGLERVAHFSLRVVHIDGDTVQDVAAPSILDEQCALSRRNLVKQGWINPYLCA